MGGESINAFLRCQNQLEKLVYGGTDEIKKKVLNKGFEIAIHSFKEDAETIFSCDLCPAALMPGQLIKNKEI